MTGTGPAHEPFARARIAALWFSVVGPPLAAFAQQQAAYALVAPACRGHAVLVQLPSLLGIGIVALAMMISRNEWRRGGATPRFFSTVGFLMSGIALAVILAQWLPTLFVDPCQR